ncbi:hypothetical protein HN51_035797 [Arachis hypogaea]|uniref:BHLH domain-containing protein n=1 Tax=Arachis hypogaea TaxID=3818 RepID=A0A445A2Y7_ARAHY|nr:transcription factor bHLH68 [Arachis ipaensis]XP_025644167.1 transcription factor bHLH68 [Arachis hypogaea]QHO00992.1 Transcription factor [Arachis hypogaea]RYR20787.1 hypothetical protein Ahy_B03g066023 [Arachis hypogaea]
MNRGGGVVEQMMGSGNPNCWNSPSSDFLSYSSTTTPSSYTNFLLNPPPPSNWHEHEHEHPELPGDSWTHLIMSGGVVGEEENGRGIWQHHASEERSVESSYVYGDGSAGKPNWSHASSTPCVTFNTSILDFSTQPTLPPPPPPPPSSAECNSIAGGGASKKARVQQSTFKVRKEKLGDRIAALHQLVSPFGKTDTASVLLEAIGYIRFLQSQIEALSLPYLVNGSPNMKHQNPVQGEKSCLFPEDPGQLLNENCLKKRKATSQQEGSQHQEEAKKDLRSRGLCLVPVSCTLQVGSDNGADYWSPAFGAGGFR